MTYLKNNGSDGNIDGNIELGVVRTFQQRLLLNDKDMVCLAILFVFLNSLVVTLEPASDTCVLTIRMTRKWLDIG